MTRVLLLLSLLALFTACDNSSPATTGSNDTTAATAQADEGCQCAAGKAGKTVWCEHCGVGYVDGKKVTDKAAVAKAQAAGNEGKQGECPHKADCECPHKAAGECPRKAAGECPHKAAGECPHKAAAGECPHKAAGDHQCGDQVACNCAAGKAGKTVWCEHCGVGYVDGKKVTDKAAVDKALQQS